MKIANFFSFLLVGVCFAPVTLAASGLYSATDTITVPSPIVTAFGDLTNDLGNRDVALSADGLTAVIAAPDALTGTPPTDYGEGKVFVYRYANGQWAQQHEFDDPDMDNTENLFGYSLALSADGNSIIIGSDATVGSYTDSGKAYLYTFSGGSWTLSHEFDDPLTPSDNVMFGYSGVAISGDGQTVVIGAADTCSQVSCFDGEAFIYTDSGGNWTQSAAIADPDGTSDYFGNKLSISEDGTRVVIGSRATINSVAVAGKAYLYTLGNGTWTMTYEFDDPGMIAGDLFGSSGVAISADGHTIVASATGFCVPTCTTGNVYIFSDSSGSWTQTGDLTDPDIPGDSYGNSIDVSQDGSVVIVGSDAAVNGQNLYGKAYTYALSGGVWSQSNEFDGTGNGSGTGRYFGFEGVAVSGDGETAFISGVSQAIFYQSPDDLSIALHAPSTAKTGQSVTLDLTVTNNDGAVTANDVIVTGSLPSGFTYSSSSAAGGSCSVSGNTVTCTLMSLAPGATWEPSITATAGSSAGSVTGTASVSSNQPDPTASNNSASANMTIQASSSGSGSSSGGGGGGLFDWATLCFLAVMLGLRWRKPMATKGQGTES